MGFLLLSGALLQEIGIESVIKKDGSLTDIYARVNKMIINNIPKTNRESLPGYGNVK